MLLAAHSVLLRFRRAVCPLTRFIVLAPARRRGFLVSGPPAIRGDVDVGQILAPESVSKQLPKLARDIGKDDIHPVI